MTRLDFVTTARANSQPHHRDTPPVDVYVVEAGLLARGSMLLSGLPETSKGSVTLLDGGSPLTVAGAAPASHRLPSWLRKTLSEEPRLVQLGSAAIAVNMSADGKLPIALNGNRWAGQRNSSVLLCSVGKDGSDDGSVECLVVVQADRCVEFGARLHLIEHFAGAAVALEGGEEVLLGLVGDAQR